MDAFDPRIHSFVIRIWLESPASDRKPGIWRGHITHIPSNHKHYFQELDAITAFIARYL